LARSLPLLSAKTDKVNELGNDLMKTGMSFLAAFLLIGTDLLARANVQGVEPALVSTAIEYGSTALVRLSTRMRSSQNSKGHR
jgi:hypothetical protein